jgi:hypothetical protein
MLLKLAYEQEAIRYKMQYMYYVSYLLYYEVISNCIIASDTYLFCFLSVCIFSFLYIQLWNYGFEKNC